MTSSSEMTWEEFSSSFRGLNYRLQKISSRSELEKELLPFAGRIVKNVNLSLLNKLVPNLDLRTVNSKFSVLFGLRASPESKSQVEVDARQFLWSFAINKNQTEEFAQDKISFAFRVFDENDDGAHCLRPIALQSLFSLIFWLG